jgi:hypothetical protein
LIIPVQIEEYISELLYDNDCVIVPDFGGFIGNYAPARIDPVKHLFEPPRKKILFNKGLVQNDGLLAHHISNRENISYSEALNHISKEVKRYQAAIKQAKRLVVDNIGVLYTDEHGNLAFQPDEKVNYLPDAFGLSAFYHLPVTQENKEEGKVIPINKTRARIRNYAAAAAIGAIITSAFWVSFNQSKLGIDYSGLNIFGKKEARQYNVIQRESLPTANTKDSTTAIAFLNIEPKTVTSTETGNFQIVAGCFRFIANAQNLVKRMQEKQINAAIIGTDPQGLYMVGYGKFSTRDQAETQLSNFRKSFVADAWVFEKPAGKI